MTLDEFISAFAEQFEDTDKCEFKAETKFRELKEWSSLISFCVFSMVEDEYEINLASTEMRACETIEELYNLCESKKGKI